jgi:mevalonate kinase
VGKFRANGKVLLTGEYLVLDGAEALALPLTLGQELLVETKDDGPIIWESWHRDGLWFKAHIHPVSLEISESWNASDSVIQRLTQIFRILSTLKPKLFDGDSVYSFSTKMDFHPDWGLGSSSTLISLLAEWAEVDPYLLLSQTFGGSGYDVACAMANGPILYHRTPFPVLHPVSLNPVYADSLLVYSGVKMNSRKAIQTWREKAADEELKERISSISRDFVAADSVKHLMDLMSEHEAVLSGLLGIETLKNSHFPDFDGQLKSLGAWGGDFFWAVSGRGLEYMREFFSSRNLNTQFRLGDIALGIGV